MLTSGILYIVLTLFNISILQTPRHSFYYYIFSLFISSLSFVSSSHSFITPFIPDCGGLGALLQSSGLGSFNL